MSDHFIFIQHQQGTPEWRAWRHDGLGASEASIIMGQNRFKSVSQLLREKRGPVPNFKPNAAMDLGTALEPEARRRYIARIGRDVKPVCIQSKQFDWLRASLDGLCARGETAVEIKCGKSAYLRAAELRAVPDLYYGQAQQIMAITHLPSMDFWCHWPGLPNVHITATRDEAYIQLLLKKGSEFWLSVRS